jgi:hypothetical protein
MAIPVLAILGVLSAVESIIQHPLVKTLLVNISRGTANKIDDFVCTALYGLTDEAEAKLALAKVQARYDAMTDEEKIAAKELRSLETGELTGLANV